jgi:ArsR family transcriptional regulator
MTNKYEPASEKLKALANPTRFQIVVGLIKDECNVGEMQRKLGVSQSTVSQHLRILRDKHIVEGKRRGTEICYKVVDKCVRKIVKCLEKEIEAQQ